MKMTITITGPCQCGKTKLAHRIAKLLRENDIPREVQVIDARHMMDDEDAAPIMPKRLAIPVEIHVGEMFPPRSMEEGGDDSGQNSIYSYGLADEY